MSVTAVRALSRAERDTIELARWLAVESAPYLAHALFSMRPVAAEGLGTLAVDAHWRLYVEPELLHGDDAWPLPTLAAGLEHEVSHLVRDHAERAQELGVASHALWNYATDAVINAALEHLALPEGIVTPESLGLPPNGVEEDYYRMLLTEPPPGSENTSPTDGEGCGSGAGDPVASWELAAGDDGIEPGADASQINAVRRRVAHDIAEAIAEQQPDDGRGGSGRGTVPAGWRRWAEEILAPPSVPWREVFAAAVRSAVQWVRGHGRPTYARPGRRQLPRVVVPASRRPRVTAAVVVDTSGSMSADQLAAALSEVEGIIAASGPHGITVLTCDADASAPAQVRSARSVELVGGGGTDLRVGIAAAEDLRPAPNVIVTLTDGGTRWPETPTRAKLIVGVTGGNSTEGIPPWAQAVSIPAPATAGTS